MHLACSVNVPKQTCRLERLVRFLFECWNILEILFNIAQSFMLFFSVLILYNPIILSENGDGFPICTLASSQLIYLNCFMIHSRYFFLSFFYFSFIVSMLYIMNASSSLIHDQ